MADYKCPRSIDFVAELPRLQTGKLYKKLLRDPYWIKAWFIGFEKGFTFCDNFGYT